MKGTRVFVVMAVVALFFAEPSWAAVSLADNGNGTVTDNVTTLMWQKQDSGLTYNWDAALTYCNTLSLGGYAVGSWRLPNVKELRSLVNNTFVSPALDLNYFPLTQSYYYWSSTTYAPNTTYAWYVSFYDGSVINYYYVSNKFYVRCVRLGQ